MVAWLETVDKQPGLLDFWVTFWGHLVMTANKLARFMPDKSSNALAEVCCVDDKWLRYHLDAAVTQPTFCNRPPTAIIAA